MDFLSITSTSILELIITTLAALIAARYLYSKVLKPADDEQGKKIPCGSIGYPVVGESLSFLRARRQDKVDEWLEERVRKYGPCFKTCLFGSKVVVLSGLAGSRLVFQGGDGISFKQPKTIVKILGNNNLFELSGGRYKLIRGAISGFFKPDSIHRFVSKMDLLVQELLHKEIDGNEDRVVITVEMVKKISFNLAWTIFFGFTDDEKQKDRTQILEDVKIMLKGAQSIPLSIPGTAYHSAIKCCNRMRKRISQLVEIKRREEKMADTDEDSIVSALVHLRDENGEALGEEEIIDNFLLLIFASHDTVSVLITLFIRHLAKDAQVYDKVLQEQMEVVKAKRENKNGRVSWKEIKEMKYSWAVAQELMRFHSPNSAFFRQTTKDITFDGFHIPKGWQVLLFPSGTHMDKNIFENPKVFDPSRFQSSSRKTYPPYSYVAFGAGPRICPGVEFGRLETMLVIHHLVTNYKWEELFPHEPITLNPIPYPAMGLPLKFHLTNYHVH